MTVKRTLISGIAALCLCAGLMPAVWQTAYADDYSQAYADVAAKAEADAAAAEARALADAEAAVAAIQEEAQALAQAAEKEGADIAAQAQSQDFTPAADAGRAAMSYEPMAAINVSGSIKASQFQDGDELVLTGNTTLDMDVPRTFKSIQEVDGNTYSLNVTGKNTFKANNPEGSCVYVGSFTSAVDVDLVASEHGIYARNGAVDITGNVTIDAGSYGIFAHTDMTINGDVNVSGDEYGLIAPNSGNMTIIGDVTVRSLAASSGYGYGIFSNASLDIRGNVDVVGYSYGILTPGSSSNTLWIKGDSIKVKATSPNGSAFGNGLPAYIEGMLEIESAGDGYNSWAPKNQIVGNVTAKCTKGAILCVNGTLTVKGNIDATATNGFGVQAVYGLNVEGNVTAQGKAGGVSVPSNTSGVPSLVVDGNLTAKSDGGTGVLAYKGANVSGNVTAEGMGYGFNCPQDSVTIDGDLNAKSASGTGVSAVYGLNVGGNLTAEGTSNAVYVPTGTGVSVGGNLTATSSESIAVEAVQGLTVKGNVVAQAKSNALNVASGAGVSVGGNLNATSSDGIAVNAVQGLDVKGDVVAKGKSMGVQSPAGKGIIVGGDLTAEGSHGVYANSVTVEGDTKAVGTEQMGLYCWGAADLKGDVTATGKQFGYYGQTLTVGGNAKFTGETSNGIYSWDLVDLYGDAEVTGVDYGIYAAGEKGFKTHGGTITVTAKDGENGAAKAAIFAPYYAELDGDVTATGGNYGIHVDAGGGVLVCKAGRIEATGTTLAIIAKGGITIEDPLDIIDPQNGSVGTTSAAGYDGQTSTFYTIQDEKGADMKHAIIAEPCTVTFDANGGYGNMDPVQVYYGDMYELPACEFEPAQCKVFDRWDAGAAGEKVKVKGDTEFKAQWKDAHVLDKVEGTPATCEEGGIADTWKCSVCGKLFADNKGTKEIDKAEAIPALGHDWGSWARDIEPTATEPGWDKRVCANDSSHVEWRIVDPLGREERTITFDLNGGTLNGKTGTYTVKAHDGQIIELPAAPTREGYEFDYWKGSAYQPGDFYKVDGDHTFTAKWKGESDDDENTSESSNNSSATDGKSGGTSGSAAAGNGSSSDIPNTGDSVPVLPIAAAALAAAAVFAVVTALRKRATR